jgi:CHAT domain-containing protein/Flp pilus assembly protein TadD
MRCRLALRITTLVVFACFSFFPTVLAQEVQEQSRAAAQRAFAEGEQLRAQGTAESLRKSIEKYQAALTHWRAAGAPREEAATLHNLGVVTYSLGEMRQALDHLSQALSLRRVAEDRLGEATTLNLMGEVYGELGEKQRALDHLRQALQLWRAVGDREGEAHTLANLGAVFYGLGEKQQARDYFVQALPLQRAVGDRAGLASTLSSLGVITNDLGEKQKALDYLREALPLNRALGDRREEATTLNNLGYVYFSLGERQRALDYFLQALPLHRAVGNRAVEAFTLNNISNIYNFLGKREQALEHYNQALPLWRALGNRRGEAITLNGLGYLYNALGQREQALRSYNQSLELRRTVEDRAGEAITLARIGAVYDAAGEKQRALEYFSQALPLHQAVGDRDAEAATLYGLARVERDLGRLSQARDRIAAALDLVESLRAKVTGPELRAAYLASNQSAYQLSIELFMQSHQQQPTQGFAALALQTNERARARSLLEMLTEARADIRREVDPTLLERERNLQQQLNATEQARMQLMSRKHTPEQAAAAEKELRDLTTQYQDLQTQIKTSNPRYAALTQPQPLTLAEIQQQVLDADTMLLEYALGEERSYLWAVSQDAIMSFELPKRADVETAARSFYEALVAFNQPSRTTGPKAAAGAPTRTNTADAGAALSRMLLAPIAARLGTKRLLVVTDGALQYVPFAALSKSASGYEPLIVEHEVVSLPSASSLAVLRRELAGRKTAPKTLAMLADPVFSADDTRLQRAQAQTTAQPTTNETREFEPPLTRAIREAGVANAGLRIPRLPGTRREAAAITSLVPTTHRKQALDFEASRAVATSEELSQYRIIHFATHSLLNSQHPELSGIVLSLVDAQGKPQDGFLRMHEIYNLKLPAELVVLSACQTGLGKEIKGEGLVGLTRGFMYAGAARVLASLWKVDDRATAELMKHFYQGMIKENLRPAAALRAAQVAMWKQQRWSEPYYWAAFVLQGEWR